MKNKVSIISVIGTIIIGIIVEVSSGMISQQIYHLKDLLFSPKEPTKATSSQSLPTPTKDSEKSSTEECTINEDRTFIHSETGMIISILHLYPENKSAVINMECSGKHNNYMPIDNGETWTFTYNKYLYKVIIMEINSDNIKITINKSNP